MTSPHSVVERMVATMPSRTSSAVVAMPTTSSPSATLNQAGQAQSGAPAGYQRLTFLITGVSPLIMHCGRLANPLDPIAKQLKRVTGKRMKTDADHEEMARIEFLGSLYLDGGEPCIPGDVIEAALVEAAKKSKRGKQAKAGLICLGNFPLSYEGPRKPDDLWADARFRKVNSVRIGTKRVMRTRPIFDDWACKISVDFRPGDLNRADVEEMVRVAGDSIGICDWRPKFGRFTADMR